MRTHLLSISMIGLLTACSIETPSKIITLKNETSKDKVDEAFVLIRDQLPSQKSELLPVLVNGSGEYVACQADDLNGNGEWDELAFVYSLKAGEEQTLTVKFIPKEQYPEFQKRTHVRLGKLFSKGDIRILDEDMHDKYNLPRGKDINNPYPYQTDGPAWENDKMGYRHYFDGRNVRDVFGKTTNLMVMDSVGIQPDGLVGNTYHVEAWWGRDIMSGAQSFGLGGLALKKGNELIRLGVMMADTTDNIDETYYKKIVSGPVRSIFTLTFKGWEVGGEKIDVEETMTIWAGKYGYENKVKLSNLPEGAKLVTGIVNDFNDMPYIRKDVGNYELMITHDKQTYNKVWYMGMAVMVDKNNWTGVEFEAPKKGPGISTTWCTELQPNENGEYNFNCCAAWEITDPKFTEREYFDSVVSDYAWEISNKSSVIM